MTSGTIQKRDTFDQLSHSQTAPLQKVQQAKILLHYAANIPILQIQKRVNVLTKH